MFADSSFTAQMHFSINNLAESMGAILSTNRHEVVAGVCVVIPGHATRLSVGQIIAACHQSFFLRIFISTFI